MAKNKIDSHSTPLEAASTDLDFLRQHAFAQIVARRKYADLLELDNEINNNPGTLEHLFAVTEADRLAREATQILRSIQTTKRETSPMILNQLKQPEQALSDGLMFARAVFYGELDANHPVATKKFTWSSKNH